MVRWPKIAALALLCEATALVGVSPELRAATSSLEVLPADHAGDGSDSVDVGGLKPLARPVREPATPLPGGNPLWAVPLSALTATEARPIFSASRRPPQRAVVAPTAESAVAPPPAQPERPALALIGAVVGYGDAIAVFLDQTTQKVVRLRQGDSHAGWQLSVVQPREVTFKKADRSEVLALKRQEATTAPAAGVLPMPVAGALDGSYAPFTPRATPKNGEPDGL
ncbi:hypothetical protein UP09_28725 [Bradyrhizobium sp. LTSP885]|uniref:hypothetical protein n=1 Tax=Bradyrhizobium sp. LTSP885 TaxID=1619232 RepID=UPI0005C8CD6D|nr:hypothetical protein [Bradyrhizobium sp. LTSP885]KJC36632.1 hypothetical protein UP09_28725 [Bradyrhizobium sp. LTSP885]